jgi:hypothetical protein
VNTERELSRLNRLSRDIEARAFPDAAQPSKPPGKTGRALMTAAEADTLFAIQEHIRKWGESPTRKEIAKARGICEGNARWNVVALQAKGWVRTKAHRPRSIEVVG